MLEEGAICLRAGTGQPQCKTGGAVALEIGEKKIPEEFANRRSAAGYARIDCDIYQPARECLHYLGPRLVDGAIAVFDDWPHVRGFGEQRAFKRVAAECAPVEI